MNQKIYEIYEKCRENHLYERILHHKTSEKAAILCQKKIYIYTVTGAQKLRIQILITASINYHNHKAAYAIRLVK